MATSQEIAQIYQQELGRTPDYAGLKYYYDLAQNGTPLSEIARQISSSAEGLKYDPSGNVFGTSTDFNLDAYRNSVSNDPYAQAARATSAENLKNAQQAVQANRVNQITPYGSLEYTKTKDAEGNPVWTATQSFSPELQKAFEGVTSQLGTYGQQFNPTLPSVGINPGEQYEQAIMRRLQPVQERQSSQLEAQLANQGIAPGTEAYERAKTQLAQQQNDQLTSAVVGGFNTGLAANQNAFNQGLTSYQLPMALLNQFRTGSQPNYVNPAQQATVAGPDYLGAYNASQNYNLGLQNAQSASNAGLFNAGASIIGAGLMSNFWK